MIVNENNSMPYMKSLATCLNRMITEGYTEDFKITDQDWNRLTGIIITNPNKSRLSTFSVLKENPTPMTTPSCTL